MSKHLPILAIALTVALPAAATPAFATPTAVTPHAVGLHPGKHSFFAPPPEGPFPGPAPISRPACKANQIETAAFTESTADGVLGVVELEGTKFYQVKHVGLERCALPFDQGPRSLVAADGAALPVPLGRADKVNISNNSFSYLDLADGKAGWGFGWFGAYCGAAPRYVTMKLEGKQGAVLDIPYDGPTPTCPAGGAGAMGSTLTDGTASGSGEPAQPAPPSYLRLATSAQFVTQPTTTSPGVVQVTISNTTAQPVTLVPCPDFETQSEDLIGKHEQFGSTVIDNRTPGCSDAPVTVSEGSPATFNVDGRELSPGTKFRAASGSTFEVEVEMAGMPTATTSTAVS